MTTSRRNLALVASAAGLAGGLALGLTGLASAADPSPSPRSGTQQQRMERQFHDKGMDRGGSMGMGMRPGMGFGHHRGSGGLVQSVGASSLTVRTGDGTKTVALNGDTSYYVGKTKSTKGAVKQGLVVAIRLVDPRADKAVAAVVTVVPAHVVGWVTNVDGSTLTVTDLSGFTRTIRTSSSTVYVKDGETGTAAVVSKGVLVRALGSVAEDGTTLEATRIAVGRPGLKDDAAPGHMDDAAPGHMDDAAPGRMMGEPDA